MKIGIFAGTFDPIHNGHIEFAKSAVESGHLDRVLLVAEKEPYRKKPHASWDHRQAMIERATEPMEQVDHDYHFASQLARQHTMKNLLEVSKQHYGQDQEYWFLIGSDVFEHMHQWRDLSGHDEYGGFVVALRDDHTEIWLHEQIEHLTSKGMHINAIIISNNHPHISSSGIRTAVKNQQPVANLPQNVETYIKQHALYR